MYINKMLADFKGLLLINVRLTETLFGHDILSY